DSDLHVVERELAEVVERVQARAAIGVDAGTEGRRLEAAERCEAAAVAEEREGTAVVAGRELPAAEYAGSAHVDRAGEDAPRDHAGALGLRCDEAGIEAVEPERQATVGGEHQQA